MGLKKIAKAVVKKALPVAKLTPAGRALSVGSTLARVATAAKRVVQAGAQSGMMPSLSQAVQRVVGVRKKRRKSFGLSSREMVELMKLQMFTGKKSLPYQIALTRAIFGRLK